MVKDDASCLALACSHPNINDGTGRQNKSTAGMVPLEMLIVW